ncbi:hypothetical protein B6D29_03790 [Microgenomates bacterium UTCPR1]|nr:MAG: hypothetical protein B6D29_03790 [Microgenomates bacterium UTCPR1]
MTFKKDFVISVSSLFSLNYTVWTLRRRAKNIIDRWDGETYERVLMIEDNLVKISLVQINESSLAGKAISKKKVNVEKVKNILKDILGVDYDLTSFYSPLSKDKYLGPLIKNFYGVRPPKYPTIFEAFVNAISCQQVTLDLGILLINRLSENFGRKIIDDGEVFFAFPNPRDFIKVKEENIKKLGYSYQKARAILRVAELIEVNGKQFEELKDLSNKDAISFLTGIKGIGRWSAEYILLRGLRRIDVFPGDDVGAQRSLMGLMKLEEKPDYDKVERIISKWKSFGGMVYYLMLLQKLRIKKVI